MFLSVFDTRDSSQSRVRLSVSDIDRLKSAHRRLSVPSCVNISWLSSRVISAATRMGGARLLHKHVLKICQTLQINSYLGKQARLSRISGVSVDSSADLLQFFEVFTSVSVGVVGFFFLPSWLQSLGTCSQRSPGDARAVLLYQCAPLWWQRRMSREFRKFRKIQQLYHQKKNKTIL